MTSERQALELAMKSGDPEKILKAKDALRSQQLGAVTAIAQTANIASGLIDPMREDGTMNVGKATGQSALQMASAGAGVGAAFGPIGAGVGAVVGAGVGAIVGRKRAKDNNEKIAQAKARNAAKRSTKGLNLASIEEEASFNTKDPDYAKGGKVEKPKKQKENLNVDVTEEDKKVSATLKELQPKLTQKFNEKFQKDFGFNMDSILYENTVRPDFDRRKIPEYGQELINKYKDLVLTSDEIKETLGEKDYQRYVEAKKKWNDSQFIKNFTTTKGNTEGQKVDEKDEMFGWRNIVERYFWTKDDKTPYGYIKDKLKDNGKGGWVLDTGGSPIADDVNKSVEEGSFVISSTKDKPKEIQQAVKKIAKDVNIDKPLKSDKSKNSVNINLSSKELVIPKDKIPAAEQSANEMGTSLNQLTDTINVMNDMKAKNKKEFAGGGVVNEDDEIIRKRKEANPMLEPLKMKLVSIDPSKEKIKVNASKTVLSKKKDSKFNIKFPSIAPEALISGAQSIIGTIQKGNAESAVGKSIARQKMLAENAGEDLQNAAYKSLAAKKASIETAFKDTKNTGEKLKASAARDLAKNSLTTQEFSSNYDKVTDSVMSSISKANNDKASLLLGAESEGLNNIQRGIETKVNLETNAEAKQNSFNLAKATQASTLQATGMGNLVEYMKSIKDEAKRKQKMSEIVSLAKERNISLQEAAAILYDDLAGVSSNIKV